MLRKSATSFLAKLYANYVHNIAHLGIPSDVSKIRKKFWIVGVRKLVSSISYKCVICKKSNGDLQQQVMGQIPIERTVPAPAWSYISLDFFDPYEIRGTTNKRSRSKGYAVIFNCLGCRAVHLDISTDYSTGSFLLVLRRFMAIRGAPIKIWSDPGSQIRAADKEMNKAIAGLKTKEIIEFGCQNSIEWIFTTPDAPWQNGCSEALIKSVQKSFECIH